MFNNMAKKQTPPILSLVACIAICEIIGGIAIFFTASSIKSDWYIGLQKPFLQPPGFIFSLIWTILFFLAGMALNEIWMNTKATLETKVKTISILGIQLIMTAYWSIIFFGMKNPSAAFMQIILLWIMSLATIIAFLFISKRAAYLLIPYIVWVSFLCYLNVSIWRNNMPTVINHMNETACTMEAKMCPDGSYVGRKGPSCEFETCPEFKEHAEASETLPRGYSLANYQVASTTEAFCMIDKDCETPGSYLMRSSCPYTSLCLDDRCTVVCPGHE
jgi:translocator protein